MENEEVKITNEQLENIVKGVVEKTLESKETKKEGNIVDEAKKGLKEEADSKRERSELENAIKFNMNIAKFVEDNDKVLPAEAKKIIETVNGKSYSSEEDKANDFRKALIESFIEKQENIDVLPSSQKEQVEAFKSLTEDEKAKQSSKFWGIVDVGAAQKVMLRRADQKNNAGSGDMDSFEKRWLAQGEKFRKKEN